MHPVAVLFFLKPLQIRMTRICGRMLNILEQIGSGSFANVHEAEDTDTKQRFALKVVELENLSQKEQERAKSEAVLLSEMEHRNIVKMFGCEVCGSQMHLLLELGSQVTIHELVRASGNRQQTIMAIVQDVCKGL